MYPWDYRYARSKWDAESIAALEKVLSAEERARLTQVQAQLQGHPESVELALDERRLTFARWLIEHGHLSEDR